VAGRRKDFRTWDELSMSERRRGLTILAGAGVVAVGVVLLVYGGTSGDSTPAGAPPPAISADAAARAPASPAATGPDLDAWYAAIAGFRTDIGQAEAAVRTAIADNNGVALQPACALLGTRASAADGASVSPPAGDAGQAWTAGLSAYRQAAQSCGQLFDGTQIPVPTLLSQTSTSLDAADTAWRRLASPGSRVADAAAGSGGAATTSTVPG
jgi:hypothetical protein